MWEENNKSKDVLILNSNLKHRIENNKKKTVLKQI